MYIYISLAFPTASPPAQNRQNLKQSIENQERTSSTWSWRRDGWANGRYGGLRLGEYGSGIGHPWVEGEGLNNVSLKRCKWPESPRSGDFYPFQRCMFDQFFQDVLCMFWPTQLRQFQECGGWIRVKLHTRLYTCHSPPHPTHTKKHHNNDVTKKSPVFFWRWENLHRTNFPVTCSSRSGWRRMQKKWSKWPVRPTIEFQISHLVYTGRAMETPSPFFNKW